MYYHFPISVSSNFFLSAAWYLLCYSLIITIFARKRSVRTTPFYFRYSLPQKSLSCKRINSKQENILVLLVIFPRMGQIEWAAKCKTSGYHETTNRECFITLPPCLLPYISCYITHANMCCWKNPCEMPNHRRKCGEHSQHYEPYLLNYSPPLKQLNFPSWNRGRQSSVKRPIH